MRAFHSQIIQTKEGLHYNGTIVDKELYNADNYSIITI
ncbi:hypothetical protein bmyco0003_4580 [Bacillus pseudomycoides]|nr:hypothetical protein bmyco0002_4520 [Bacillus pseudomycoides]EEM12723.1 hypothetical protein bmyco0003_4580 [Bacillus pseudomycoides]OOG90295.1 hypothetical protein BTH41_03359 [Bacillus mycoides]